MIQTGKSEPFPVILIGSDFWSPLVDWMRTYQVERNAYISAGDLQLFEVTDDVLSAVRCIADAYKSRRLRLASRSTPDTRSTGEGTIAAPGHPRPQGGPAFDDLL